MPVVHSLFRESGKTVIDHQRCSGCEQCVTTCSAKVLSLVDGKVEQSEYRVPGSAADAELARLIVDGGPGFEDHALLRDEEDLLLAPDEEDGTDEGGDDPPKDNFDEGCFLLFSDQIEHP